MKLFEHKQGKRRLKEAFSYFDFLANQKHSIKQYSKGGVAKSRLKLPKLNTKKPTDPNQEYAMWYNSKGDYMGWTTRKEADAFADKHMREVIPGRGGAWEKNLGEDYSGPIPFAFQYATFNEKDLA